jgi:hypothetical protein
MTRAIRRPIVAAFAACILLAPRVASAQLAFEVATIKPQDPRVLRLVGGSCHGIDSNYPPNAAIVPPLGRCLITFSLSSLLSIAYTPPVPAGGISRITGGPDWVSSDFWLVEAKADEEYVLLYVPYFQLVILQIPNLIAANSTIDKPPRKRENTPIKLFLNVGSIENARQAAKLLGGEVNIAHPGQDLGSRTPECSRRPRTRLRGTPLDTRAFRLCR